jgi:hypothetical protein
MSDNLRKIRFLLDPKDWHGQASETLWAEPIARATLGSAFALSNTPFFVRGVSFMDIVRATPATGALELEFAGAIEHSGHSTYMLLVSPVNGGFDEWWAKLQSLGCTYESKRQRTSLGEKVLYAVDVPPSSDIYAVYHILKEGERKNIWMFQEGHVGHKLRTE